MEKRGEGEKRERRRGKGGEEEGVEVLFVKKSFRRKREGGR